MALSFLYQNVRGLKTKLNDIYINTLNCDHAILCLTETWLNPDISSSECFPNSYNVYRRDRADTALSYKKDGGGVLIAVDSKIRSVLAADWCSDAEDLWVTVCLQNATKIHVCCVYIAPCDTVGLSSFCSKLDDIFSNHPIDNFVICGDFNLPNIRWSRDPVNKNCIPLNFTDKDSNLFVDTLAFCGLSQYNYLFNSSGNTLDLILNNKFQISNIKICDSPLVNEDKHHNTLEFGFISNDIHPSYKLCNNNSNLNFNFDRADFGIIKTNINSVNWEECLFGLDTENSVKMFYSIIKNIIIQNVPTYPNFKCRFPSWFGLGTIRVVREKNKMHRKWKRYKNDLDYLTFKLLRGRSKYLINVDYQSYIGRIEDSILNDSKQIWNFVKSKRGGSGCISALQDSVTKETITDGRQICETFSAYFNSVYTQNNVNYNQNYNNSSVSCQNNIPNYYIPVSTIIKKIKELPNKAAGIDGIPTIFIKNCVYEISKPLYIIFNRSLNEGCFPRMWSSALIVPIFKSGNKFLVENYRPISKLCIIAKLFESIVCDYLYLDCKNVINPEQHGFMKKRSVDSNLFIYSQYLLDAMDAGLQVDAIYTDFSKAFDKIDHNILKNKLAGVGVHGSLLGWFSSYISNRTQAVKIGVFTSTSTNIGSGVPQGSHLGPLLFNIYINDIFTCFKFSKFLMYADDLKLYKKIANTSDTILIQQDLNNLFEYCKRNYLYLNLKKCHTITFTRNTNKVQFNYNIDNTILNRVSVIKDIGVYFDTKMIFDHHVQHIVAKAKKSLGFIIRTCKCFKKILSIRALYMSYVNSVLSFGSVIWNPRYDIYIDKIEQVQHKFIKYLNNKFYTPNTDISTIKKNLNLLSLEDRRQLYDVKFVYKIMNNMIDSASLVSLININVPTHDTRNKYFFRIYLSSTNYHLNSPLNRCCKSYNTFLNLVNLDICFFSLTTFSNTLKQFYLNHIS